MVVCLSMRRYVMMSTMAAGVSVLSAINRIEEEPTFHNVAEQIMGSKISRLIVLNTVFSFLVLAFSITVRVFFGELRAIEAKKLRRTLGTLLISKALVLVTLYDSEYTNTSKYCSAWITGAGFLIVIVEVTKNRYAHVIANPTALSADVIIAKMIVLLVLVTILNTLWLKVWLSSSIALGSVSLMLLMAYDAVRVYLDILRLVAQITIHFIDLSREEEWEEEGTRLAFLSDSILHLVSLTVMMLHWLHVLGFNGFVVALIDIITFFMIRRTADKIMVQISKLRGYVRVMHALDTQYFDATKEELDGLRDEVCAICLKPLLSAKKLPCGHFYHQSCLRQCFGRPSAREYRCPICRRRIDQKDPSGEQDAEVVTEPNTAQELPHGDSIFRMSSDQFPNWLPVPNFQFEIMRRGAPEARGVVVSPDETPDMNDVATMLLSTVPPAMIRQVQEIFPQIQRELVIEDLERTRSADLTIENILTGRIDVE